MSEPTMAAETPAAHAVGGEIVAETVEAIIRDRGEPDWLAERRRQAWEVYAETPFPTTRSEEWRYTDLSKIGWEALAMRESNPGRPVDTFDQIPEEIRASLHPDEEAGGSSVHHNGVALWSRLSEELADQGVLFLDFDRAIRDHSEVVKKYFMTSGLTCTHGKMVALHDAFVSGGTVVYVPEGVEVDLPLTVLRWLDVERTALFPHTLIVAGANSRVTLIEELTSPAQAQEGLAMNCGATKIIAEEGASVRYGLVQEWGRHVFHYQAVRVMARKDARVQTLLVTLGGRVARADVETDLQAPGGHSEMLGIYLGDSDQHFDHYTYQLHAAPHAGSDLLYKGALKDRSRAVFRGMIRVMPDAQGTDAYQTNRNLILSEDAHADSLPNLEIEADDVRCSHGATVGQQDEQQIFYLMSRGLSRAQAEKLIVVGFFEEVLSRLDVEPLHRRLSAVIERKLGV